MKKLSLLSGAIALLFVGCSSDRAHYSRYHTSTDHYGDRHETVVVQPGTRVIVDRDGRTYVRERDMRYYDSTNPRWNYRGKHPDTLGWNDPYWYRY
jgi:hypothetical protein